MSAQMMVEGKLGDKRLSPSMHGRHDRLYMEK